MRERLLINPQVARGGKSWSAHTEVFFHLARSFRKEEALALLMIGDLTGPTQ
jgi:hypothetical protein